MIDGYVLCQECGFSMACPESVSVPEICPLCSGDFCGCNSCHELARLNVQFQSVSLGSMARQLLALEAVKARADVSPVKGTPGSRMRSAGNEMTEHRTVEDVAKRTLDPPRT